MARLVLVHGAFCGAWIWGPLSERLKSMGHFVEALDLPGLGEDHTPAKEITLDACAKRVCELLAAHPEPAIVIGHSMGGIIATQGAARTPERVASLVYVTAFLPKHGQSLLDLTKLPEGAGDQVQANIVIEGEPPIAIMPAGRFAFCFVRLLPVGNYNVGDQETTSAATRTIRYACLHPARRSRQQQPVLRHVHPGPGYHARFAAPDDRRESVR